VVRAERKSINEQTIYRRCHILLVKLMEHRHKWLFNEPVDVKGLQAVGYYDTIKTPMDLGTVKCPLEKGRYYTPIEFAEDINMTFKNALKFNNRRDAAYHMTEELLEIFKLEWSKTEADIAMLSRMHWNSTTDILPINIKRKR
jgi:Bromodomain